MGVLLGQTVVVTEVRGARAPTRRQSGPEAELSGAPTRSVYRVRPAAPTTDTVAGRRWRRRRCGRWTLVGMRSRDHQPRRPSSSPFRAAPEPVYEVFVVDSRVIHDRHGIGRVLSVRGDRMDVRFGAGIVDVDIRSSKVHLL